MKEIHTPSGTRSRPALARDLALDTRTSRAWRSVHPTLGHHTTLHSDTTSGYTLRGSAHTTLGRSSSTTPGHHFRIHPSSGFVRLSRARQNFTTSRSVLQTCVHWRMNTLLIMVWAPDSCLSLATSTVLLLPYELLFTSRSSNTVSLRSRSISSTSAQNQPKLEAHTFLISSHGSISFPKA